MSIREEIFCMLAVAERAALGQQAVWAREPIGAGHAVAVFGAKARRSAASRMTVQVRESEHIELVPECLQYINHSCEPNVFFDVDRGLLIALRDIAVNEELTFFYPSTEWQMATPFHCHCGSRACLQWISGAHAVAEAELARYRVSSFIARRRGMLERCAP